MGTSAIRIIILLVFTFQATGAWSQVKRLSRIEGDSLKMGFHNPLVVPVFIKFKLKEEHKGKVSLREQVLIPAKEEVPDVLVLPLPPSKDTSGITFEDYAEVVSARMGNPFGFKPDKRQVYELPFPKGKSYKVSQSYKGAFSHRMSPSSAYAIDFKMPIGDTVTAARAGVVVIAVDRYKEAGGKELINKANKVFIAHDDGTFGDYHHLDYKGVFVEPGQRVEAGQAIGLSGHNGFSSIPHLHFAVLTPHGTSIPVRFKGYKRVKKLQVGKYYKRK